VPALPIRQGDIFWLDGCRPLHGDVAKRRPVIVITPTDRLDVAPEVLVVACTSSPLHSDRSAIELPSRDRMPQTKTGLIRSTWAIPAWMLPVDRDLLNDRAGYISRPLLKKLLMAVAEAHGNPS
jgi:mRNA-degrading endonuclease toxin of MazEF toxin-antitoxin module